jgi:hypothetical protein
MPWTLQAYWLSGFSSFAGQAIQIQFYAITNNSLVTNFVIDMVSLDIACGSGVVLPTRARPSIREMNP